MNSSAIRVFINYVSDNSIYARISSGNSFEIYGIK